MIPHFPLPPQLAVVCRAHDIAWLGVFGSVARQQATATSDLDLLVRFGAPKSLFRVVATEDALSELFTRPVDLVTEAALSPYLRDRILAEMQVIYAAG